MLIRPDPVSAIEHETNLDPILPRIITREGFERGMIRKTVGKSDGDIYRRHQANDHLWRLGLVHPHLECSQFGFSIQPVGLQQRGFGNRVKLAEPTSKGHVAPLAAFEGLDQAATLVDVGVAERANDLAKAEAAAMARKAKKSDHESNSVALRFPTAD